MPTIATQDGTELYVKERGAGRPVLPTHGWPLDADMWDDRSRALAEAESPARAVPGRPFAAR